MGVPGVGCGAPAVEGMAGYWVTSAGRVPEGDVEAVVEAPSRSTARVTVLAGCVGQQHQVERMLAVDGLAVDGGDDVAVLEAGRRGGAVGDDGLGRGAVRAFLAVDPGAVLDAQVVVLGHLGVDGQVVDADPRPRDRLAGLDLLDDGLGEVDGDGEADALCGAGLRGVDADDLAVAIERAARRSCRG